jgi:hypothetical protein
MHPRRLLLVLFSALVTCLSARALANPWSAERPEVLRDVANGRPLVVEVLVPLCSNRQIDCGGRAAGNPDNLATNLYWGAIFGARRFLERKNSGWERIELREQTGERLERAVYRRFVGGALWGLAPDRRVEQIVVLQAVRGSAIDHAVESFWSLATTGGSVEIVDAGKPRLLRLHVVGYAGHNRLMDGMSLPESAPGSSGARALSSFVLACHSESYFGGSLRRAGSSPLVMTRALMAPEGYLLEAVLRGLGENDTRRALRARAVRAYARWQRLSEGQAGQIFAR